MDNNIGGVPVFRKRRQRFPLVRRAGRKVAWLPLALLLRCWNSRICLLLLICVLTYLLFATAACAYECTAHGTATAGTSTAVEPAVGQRRYLFVQNSGTANPMSVAIGSNNAATVADIYLAPGSSLVWGPDTKYDLPGGDVAVYSGSGSTYAFCDF
jgi:hypothetical protein